MNEDEIRKIVNLAVEETLSHTLVKLGLNPKDVHETQADMVYLRTLRKGSEDMALKIKASIIGISIPTALYLLWHALKNEIITK